MVSKSRLSVCRKRSVETQVRRAKRRAFAASVELLEDRRLMDAGGAHVFARFAGTLNAPAETKQFEVNLTSANFQLSGTSTILGLRVQADGSSLDPAAVQIVNTATGAVAPLYSYPDQANRAQSLVLANLVLGNYRLTVGGERSTAGAFRFDVFLVGDVDGNRSVNTDDGLAIRNILGTTSNQPAYKIEADANLDGLIDTFDYARWRTNLADATTVNPLNLTVTGLSPDPLHLPDGTLLTNTTQHSVFGSVTNGATVALETGADNNFDEGSTVGANGGYSLSLASGLAEGTNTVRVRARESFGQERFGSLQVIVDTLAPVVTAGLSRDTAPGGTTDNDARTSDPAIAGQITDAGAITSLRAGLDATSEVNFVEIASSLLSDGSFTLSRSQLESIYGASLADGLHTLHLKASDQAGNSSSIFDVSFTLDSTAPTAVGPSGNYTTAPDALDINYSEAMATSPNSASAFNVANYSLVVIGGANNGQSIPITLSSLGPSGVRIIPGSTLASENYELRIASSVSDLVGNALGLPRSFPFSVAVDQTDRIPPVISADLVNDTGFSSDDGVTQDPAMTGTVLDASPIASFGAKVDDLPGATYFNVLPDLQANGTFTFTRARLEQIRGSALTDGRHTLRLIASDSFGNQSSLFDIVFTLDSELSNLTFDLSSGSDTGTVGDRTTTAARVTLVGQTDPGSTVTLQPGGATALASGQGTFQFVDVDLAVGANSFTAVAVDPAGNTRSFSSTITREAAPAAQDVVLQWNQIALEAIRSDATTPPEATRYLAMAQLAVFDTVSGLDGTPGYYVSIAPPASVSIEAAVSAAAERVLEYAYPGQAATFQGHLNTILATIPDGPAKTNALAYGRQVADAIIAIRSSDGWDNYVDYVPNNTAGHWQPTGPMYDVALLPHWGNLTPFAMTAPDQFLPEGQPDLNSTEYATALNEVKQLGRATGSTRTAEQTEIARFWADGSGTYTPPGHWNQIADQILQQQGNSLSANARILAQLNVGLADASILVWNAKYEYDFWRPVTAIQRADDDSNDATEPDSEWSSFLITPPFPEYVSGHSTFSGTAAEILTAVIGDNVAFTTTSYGLPGVQRSYDNFQDAANEAGRSRIYGGIHFEFSNQDGLAAGRELADYVLQRFSVTSDTQAPTVILQSPTPGLAYDDDITITGLVTDTLSGVDTLQYTIDGGTPAPLSFDAQGNFALPLSFALDGSADGYHTIQFIATDLRGNASQPIPFSFTLDTRDPLISVTSPASGGVLSSTSQLQGTANPTGSGLVLLTYAFDGGDAKPLAFNPSTGAFNQALDLSDVAAGAHTLSVTAVDAAGNSSTVDIPVTVETIPLELTAVQPSDGSVSVGSTYRPRIDFSKAVDTSTLTSDNFYASFGGQKLPATIVPSSDGRFAWLFFTNPMPNASLIRVTVDGTSILAADGSGGLDADGDGTPGGVRTFDFTTVSLAPVANTTLSGKVLDPGVDLKPMTFDDIRAGQDGILHTADDVYLRPLANVKVFILGLEDQAVYTDAQGNFSLTSVPGGNVKLAVDGRTATNTPDGIYFPEMVMDLNIEVGQANTVMGTMGDVNERAANRTRPEVYLPRVQTEILQTVSETEVTTVETIPEAAPNLSPEQRSYLQMELQPGSSIGPDGLPLTDAQVGISTVPPELVRDMLPPGVLQHTFDITIQAPGTDRFAAPAKMTFPNVFNAAPGTKLDFLSFDHTTGRLVIEGTATVSPDGKSVTTDPGTGVTHPGWHGLTPPGGCGGSGSPPPPPPPPPTPQDTVNEHPPEVKPMIFGESGGDFSKTWTAPPKTPDAPPTPPPPPGCSVPPPPPPGQKQQPYLNVSIQVDGPLAEFMKKDPSASDALPLSSYSFTLQAGQSGKVIFAAVAKTFSELLGGPKEIKKLEADRLYGSQIKITEIRGNADGSKTYDKYTYYLYRFINGSDSKTDDTINFEDTIVDGIGNVERTKNLEIKAGGASRPTVDDPTLGEPFFVLGGGTRINFDPTTKGDNKQGQLDVKAPGDLMVPGGKIKMQGNAKAKQEINLEYNALKTALVDFSTNFDTYLPGQAALKTAYRALVNDVGPDPANPLQPGVKLANSIKARVVSLYSGFAVNVFDSQVDATASVKNRYTATSANLYGTSAAGGGVDLDKPKLVTYFTTYTEYSPVQQGHQLDQYLNKTLTGLVDTYISTHVTSFLAISSASFINNFAMTIAHEDGHNIGLNHPYDFKNAAGADTNPHPDIMSYGYDNTGTMSFATNYSKSVLKIDVNGDWDKDDVKRANTNLLKGIQKGRFRAVDGADDDGDLEEIEVPGPNLAVIVDDVVLNGELDFGSVLSDGAGATTLSKTFTLLNFGTEPVVFSSVSIPNSSGTFSLATAVAPGTTIGSGESLDIVVRFDPLSVGEQEATLAINSNALNSASEVQLSGFGVGDGPLVQVVGLDNNLGGVAVASGASSTSSLATIANWGDSDLIISAINLTEGTGRFTLSGLPANFPASPITLHYGESFTIGATFDPDRVGLDRALIDITTNDANHSVQRISVVGTGLADVVYPEWGNDYQAVDTPELPGSDTLRTVSDENGNFSLFLPPSTAYSYSSFDPDTGLIAFGYGETAASGQYLDLAASLVFGADASIDSDFDGLSDQIEHTIGTNPAKRDTNKDGVDDFTAIQTGIDPLGLEGLPLGVVGTIKPEGTINVQDVVASSDTAYLAADYGGVQVVDISNVTKPSVIASIPASTLGGHAKAVSFTSIPGDAPGTFVNLVAAALGNDGLAIIDVTDPPAAHLLTRVPVPGSALSVQIVDNLAYVGGSGGLVSILDMKSQELVTTFSVAGSGDVTAVKFNAGILYTLRGGTLAAYDISANLVAPTPLSTLALPGAARLFVGADRAYVTGLQVFEAIDITDPANLRNSSGERPALNYGGLAVNGSGRLVVSETATFDGNYRVGLFNVSDPDNTNGFLTEFETPGTAPSLFIQNGFALIADGAGGLSLFNYLPFDQGSQAPTITVSTTAYDDSHVVEGSRLRVDVSTFDDVQTRHVTLSANGTALEPDGSYPFSFFVDVPTLASGATEMHLLVTATDTGGNQSSRTLDFTIVPDTVAPRLLSIVPPDNRIQFNSVTSMRATFDEPLDTSTINSNSVRIIGAGTDGQFGTADDVSIPLSELDFDFRLSINMLTVVPTAPLAPGKYELQLDSSEITDRAGNPLGTGVFKSHVTVQAIPFNSVIPGEILTPGQLDLFSFPATAGGEVTLFADWYAGGNGLGSGQISLLAPDGSTVLATTEGSNTSLLADVALPTTGTYTVRVRAPSNRPLALGTYQFTISDPSTTPQSIAYGQTKTGTIAVRGDDQEWQFAATTGDQVVFSYVGPALEEGIRFVNPDGTTELILPPGSTLVRFAKAVPQTGNYLFVIDTDLGSGNYTIQLDRGSFTDEINGVFNTLQNGNLNPLYNVDRYRYHLAAGQTITAYANMSGIGEGQLRLLDATTGAELAPPQSGADAQITRFTSAIARDVFVEVRGKPGIYFHTGSYSLSVSDPETSYETLAFGGEQTRSIAVRGDDQEWQFVATGGEVVTLGYRGPHLATGFQVLKPDGTTLAVFPAGSSMSMRDLKLSQAGTYRFVLADNTATGSYTLNLSNPADVESPGALLTTNVTKLDAIDTVFDIDVFRYQATAGQSFSLLGQWLPTGTGLGSGEIQLIDPSGVTVGTTSGATASSIAVASAVAGTYSVRIRAASTSDFNTGAYRLTAFSGAEAPTNDTLATATDVSGGEETHYSTDAFLGNNVYGVRDVDLYRFNASRGDQIVAAITAASTGSDLDSYLRLFDSSGNQIAFNDNFGVSPDSTLQYTVLTTGTYFIGVSSRNNPSYNPTVAGSGNAGSVGPYKLALDVRADHAGPRVTAVSPTGVSTSEEVTQFLIDFDETLNSTTATNPANYRLAASTDGVFDNGNDTAISFTVSYDNARRVTLTVANPLTRGDTYRLTLLGTGDQPITDIAGNRLNDGVDESHVLDLVTSVGTPTTTFPLFDGLESGSLADYWTVSTSGSAQAAVITGETPHAGQRHLKMNNPGSTAGRSIATLLVDYSALPAGADVDLSFFHRDDGDSNQSMPSSFAGRVNADGVAISNDGVNWVRIDDLGAGTNFSYGLHAIDLNGAVQAAGLRFDQPIQILFQHFLYPGESAYFDDIRVAADLSGPTITSISTPGPLVFSNNLSSIVLEFSEPLQVASAVNSTSYQLLRTDTGTTISISATYDNAAQRVTLATGALLPASYRLTVRGNPSTGTQVRDANGNLLNNGADSVFNFELFTVETPANDETDSATSTGLTHIGGTYSLTTAIGNNQFGGRDVDLYRFTAEPGDRISASIDSQYDFTNSIDTYLKLFDADGNLLASNDNAPFTTDSRLDGFEILTTGTYYFGVSTSANVTYNPLFAPSGTTGPMGKYRFNMSLTPDATPPTVAATAPHAGPNSNPSVQTVALTFDEPVIAAAAGNSSNYILSYLGADGAVGGGDDVAYAFTTAYSTDDFKTTLTLSGPTALLPLPLGNYRLTAKGSAGGITDLAGNRLNGGVDFVQNFSIIGPEDPLNDRLADAYDTGIAEDGGQYTIGAAIGDNAFAAKDVDLYALQARAGLRLTVAMRDFSIGSPLSARLRVFNSAGSEVAAAENAQTDDSIVLNITTPDTYYIGVSGSGNYYYNPSSPGSGQTATTTGEYILTITTEDVIPPTVTSLLPAGIVTSTATTQIVVQFSEPMNVTAAESSASYIVTLSGADRRFGTADDVTLPNSAYTATYDIGNSRVRLNLTDPIPNGDARLTLLSAPLVDRAGLHLNGGVDEVRTLSVVTAGAALPLFDPLDTAPLAPSWVTTQSDANAIVEITSDGTPRRGAGHLRLSSTAFNQWTTATNILAVNAAGSTQLELSFYEKRGVSEYSTALPASFTGNVLGDGVAIGVDGEHWYRIVNLAAQSGYAYDHYIIDLDAAAAANGLSLSGTLFIRFSNSEYYGGYSPLQYARYFDDIRVAAGATAPVVSSLSQGNFLVAAVPNSIGVVFSKSVTSASATTAANYQLIRAGADRALGTADDVTVPIDHVTYDDITHTATVVTAATMPTDAFRISILPGVEDADGVPLNEGLEQKFDFDASASEVTEDQTLATATSTGLSTTDGTYSIRTAIGNDSHGVQDIDNYSLSGQDGQRLAVVFSHFGVSNANLKVRILDATGVELAAANTQNNLNPQLVVTLPSTQTYYVSVAPLDAAGGRSLYDLRITTKTGVAIPPISEGFESPDLPLYFTTYSSDSTGIIAPTTLYPGGQSGTRSLALGNTGTYSLEEANLTFDATVLGHSDLSFYAFLPYYEYYYSLYALAPTGGSYTGHYNGDGAAFSVDGNTWYPLVDYAATRTQGRISFNTWTHFTVDLSAAAEAAGVTLNDHTQIRFQNYGYAALGNSFYSYGIFIDNVRIDTDLLGPRVSSATGLDGFAVASDLTELSVTFNEPLDAGSATVANNYRLQSAGPDKILDTSDDVIYTTTPSYDDASNTTTLAIAEAGAGLPIGTYRLRLTGTGSTPLKDVLGNVLYDGVNKDIVFTVFPPEGVTNNTLSSATLTGLTASGGTFQVGGMLGNDGADQTATYTDVDVYRLQAAPGQILYVSGKTGSGNPDLRVRIFDADGNEVTSYDDDTSHEFQLDWFPLTDGGVYYVAISESLNDSYDPDDGSGATAGATRGLYDLSITLIKPAAFPFSDNFESGDFNGAVWEKYTAGGGVLRVSNVSPLQGSYSAVFTTIANPAGYVYPQGSYQQSELTLHVDLQNQADVELRFKERNNYDYYSYNSEPDVYSGRYFGADGLYLSVDGTTFYRIPDVFDSSVSVGSGIRERSIDIDEFAALHGLTLGSEVLIRFQSNIYYSYDYNRTGRQIDDVRLITDTTGPIVTDLVHNATGDSGEQRTTELLNDTATVFTATFDDRLDANVATDPAAYEWRYAGTDGVFGNADDRVFDLTASYDGNFQVTLGVEPSAVPYPVGVYRLTLRGTGGSPLTDGEGNPLNDGANTTRVYAMIDPGPRVISANPADEANIAPAIGFSSLDLTFNEAVLSSSFSSADVRVLDASGQQVVDQADIAISGSGTDWRITFPTIHAPGRFSVAIGPDVRDLAGNPMNQNYDLSNGAADDSFVTNVRVSDTASTALKDNSGFLYDIQSYGGSLSDGGRVDPVSGQQTHYDSYDGFHYLSIGGTSYGNYDNAYAIEDNGRTVVLSSELVSGLNVHREVYVPADGNTFARFVDVFSNASDLPITRRVSYTGNLGSDGSTVITSSGSGDLLFDTSDTYLGTDDADNANDLSLAHIFMDGTALGLAEVFRSGDSLRWSYDITVGPGQTVRLMTFETQRLTRAEANSIATGLVALPAGALANLSDEEKGTILNFDAGLDAVGPFVASNDLGLPNDQFGDITQIRLTFSEPLNEASAEQSSHYSLVSAGPDKTLGTADDVSIALTPTYDAATRSATLAIASGSTPLAADNYRLKVLPSVTDLAGNEFGNGDGQSYDFRVIHSGPSIYYAYADETRMDLGWSAVYVYFDRSIDGTTFKGADVRITDSEGISVVDSTDIVVSGSGNFWTISFAAITEPGQYFVAIGPDIRDTNGRALNMDGDSFNGEDPDDIFHFETVVTPVLIDQGGFVFDIDPYDGTVSYGGQIDTETGELIKTNSYDSMYSLEVGAEAYASQSGDSTLSTDGRTVALAAADIGGLNVHREIYVPADDQFVRYIDVLTNNSSSAVVRRVLLSGYAGPSSSTVVTATSSGDLTFGANDHYLATDDGIDGGDGTLSIAHVITDGFGQASVSEASTSNFGFVSWAFDVTVAPGETVRILTFGLQQATRSQAQSQAEYLVGLPSNALEGLSDSERLSIVNFDVPVVGGVPLLLENATDSSAGQAAPVTEWEASRLLREALNRWATIGLDQEQIRRLSSMSLELANLSGDKLALASTDTIFLDRDAAGQGWYIDPVPTTDSEFLVAGGADAGKVDLLTVLMHELGHALGMGHSPAPNSVMSAGLPPGIRRSPTTSDSALLEILSRDASGAEGEYQTLQLAAPLAGIASRIDDGIAVVRDRVSAQTTERIASPAAEPTDAWHRRADVYFTSLDQMPTAGSKKLETGASGPMDEIMIDEDWIDGENRDAF